MSLNMKLQPWMPEQIAVFDTETTGVDTENDRIVTAFIGVMNTVTREFVESWQWLVNPGVEIPKGASDVHGITNEKARAEGVAPADAIFEIMQRLDILARKGLVLVAMNASFDFTILDREIERHLPGTRPLMEVGDDGRIHRPVVFDPMVMDRAVDKWRKGTRKLVDLAAVYNVPVEANAHDAGADCLMAGRIAIKLLGHSRLAQMSLSEVHDKLIPTKFSQAKSLAEFWRDKKLPNLKRELQQAMDPERQEALRIEIAQLEASIQDVLSRGVYWPMVPRPTTKEQSE